MKMCQTNDPHLQHKALLLGALQKWGKVETCPNRNRFTTLHYWLQISTARTPFIDQTANLSSSPKALFVLLVNVGQVCSV